MQISISLFVVCAAAALMPASAFAADSPAQAKARQALDQMYRDGGTTTAPAIQQPAASQPKPAPAAAAPAQQRAPVVRQQPAQSAPAQAQTAPRPMAPSAGAPDSETVAKMRAALRATMASGETATSVASSTAPPTQVPAAEETTEFSAMAATNAEADKIEESRAAVRRQLAVAQEEEQAAAAQKESDQYVPAPLRGVGNYKQLEGPPSPFTADQQQKLADLLKRYRADDITPEQYHAERAKIISGK